MALKTVCVIPIKLNSKRVPKKNFKKLGGKELYKYVIEKVILSESFDEIYIDSDSDEIKEYALQNGLKFIDRKEWLASDNANGNDLLVYHRSILPEYDYYFQIFATSPFVKVETIKQCCNILTESSVYDSITTVTKESGWFWINNQPVNFRPGILPRSQDAPVVIKETTSIYGISAESLDRYNCRIGANPYFYEVDKMEAVDIDNYEDFEYAEYLVENNSKNDIYNES